MFRTAKRRAWYLRGIGKHQRLRELMTMERSLRSACQRHNQRHDSLDLHPADELLFLRGDYVTHERVVKQWLLCGGKLFEDRMVAWFNAGVWERMSAFGLPYPPFDFCCGFQKHAIWRKECNRLGLDNEVPLGPKRNENVDIQRWRSAVGLEFFN